MVEIGQGVVGVEVYRVFPQCGRHVLLGQRVQLLPLGALLTVGAVLDDGAVESEDVGAIAFVVLLFADFFRSLETKETNTTDYSPVFISFLFQSVCLSVCLSVSLSLPLSLSLSRSLSQTHLSLRHISLRLLE